MKWNLSTGAAPAYVKLINLITDAIATGQLLPGEQLPTERQLSQELNLNRSTIQHAFSELVSRGILIRKMGSGTWVNSGKWGVLATGINWQTYLSTNRLGDPQNFMVQLRKLEQSQQPNFNLSHTSVPNQLAIPLTMPNHVDIPDEAGQVSGSSNLKQALNHRLTNYLGNSLPESEVLITSGAQQAFYLITQGLLSYGDAIAVEMPSYFYELSLFQAAGIRVYGVPLNAYGELDLTILEKLFYQHNLRFLFVNPTGQNPTGQTMGEPARRQLITICSRLKLPIVEDEQLGLNNAILQHHIIPLKRLDPDNVIYVGSMSAISGSSTRIGWLIAPGQVVSHLAEIRQQMEAGLSFFPQMIATTALTSPQLPNELVNLETELNVQKSALIRALTTLKNDGLIDFSLPTYGNHVWCKLMVDRTLSPSEYQAFLKHNLLVRPAFLFGLSQNFVRISFTQFRADQINGFVAAFKAVMHSLRH